MAKKRNRRFTRCAREGNIWHALHGWYASSLGEALDREEQEVLRRVLGNLFGYYLLFVGSPKRECMLESRVSRQMVLDIGREVEHFGARQIQGRPEAMPVQTDILDVIVLPHILEFSDNPHEVLREVDRVLIPEGHVVVAGFNPYSIWSLWRLALGWRHLIPWCGHFISTTRLKDWLALLGFDIVAVHYYFYRPPIQHTGLLRRLAFLDRLGRFLPFMGGGYVLVARKKVSTLTPIRPRWRAARKLAPGLVEPFSMKRNRPD